LEVKVVSHRPLTIRDYLAQLSTTKDISRRSKVSSLRPDAAGDPFTRLLTSSLHRAKRSLKTSVKGLTAIDYLANPIAVIQPGQRKNTNTPPNATLKEEGPNPVVSSAAHPASSANPTAGEATKAISIDQSSQQLEERSSAHGNASDLKTIDLCIREAADKYDISPNLIRAVVKAESNFKINAISRAGAQGLMQLMPDTARELGVNDPFDIRQNIDGGTRYLRQMLDLFGGDIRKALSAYNAGPGNVIKYGGNVPFSETKQYVSRVLNTAYRSG
jgi:soluble lytic murein transglycosylase-like protein